MAIRNPKREELKRLASKTLDAQLKTTIQEGLNCSPFEAEVVLDVVHEVYVSAGIGFGPCARSWCWRSCRITCVRVTT